MPIQSRVYSLGQTLALFCGLFAAACGDPEAALSELGSVSAAVRASAAHQLGRLGDDSARVRLALREAVDDADPGVRDTAAWALFRLEPDALPWIVEHAGEALGERFATALPAAIEHALDRDQMPMLLAISRAMRALGKPGEAALREQLGHGKALVRSWAADGLACIGAELTSGSVAALGEALGDENIVRISAAGALRHVGERAADAVPALCRMLQPECSVGDWVAAADALEAIGPRAGSAAEALGRMLVDGGEDVRWGAGSALAAVGRAAVEPLVGALSSDDEVVRFIALDALTTLGELAAPAVDHVLAHLRREAETPDNRQATMRVLGAIGAAAQTAAPTLHEFLAHADDELAVAAAQALWLVEGPAEPMLALLRRVLELGSDEPGHYQALLLTAEMGPAAAELAPQLLPRLFEEESLGHGRRVAVALRGTLREVPACLEEHRGSTAPRTRALVALALSGVETERERSLACLRELLGNTQASIRALAVEFLGEFAGEARPLLDDILALLDDDDEDVRREARFAIPLIAPELEPTLRWADEECSAELIERLRHIAEEAWKSAKR